MKTWLANLKRRWLSDSNVMRSGRQRRRAGKPAVEALEDRIQPAVITVTSLADGTLAALAGDGAISLREAIQAAETDTSVDGSVAGAGSDQIVFAAGLVSGGSAVITLSAFDDGLDSGEFGATAFKISTAVAIQGPTGDNGITLNRALTDASFRLFQVTATGSLTLDSLTLSGGHAAGGQGGSYGGGGGAGLGGAVFNQGTLTVTRSTFAQNSAEGGRGGVGSSNVGLNAGDGGGGVGAPGTFAGGGGPNGGSPGGDGGVGGVGGVGGGGGGGGPTGAIGGNGGFGGGGGFSGAFGVVGGDGGFGGGGGASSLGTSGSGGFGGAAGNSFLVSGGGGAGLGGAIFNLGGTVTLTDSTFFGNSAGGGSPLTVGGPPPGAAPTTAGLGYGGAVFSRNGTVTLVGNTFQLNSASTTYYFSGPPMFQSATIQGFGHDLFVLGDGSGATDGSSSGAVAQYTLSNNIFGSPIGSTASPTVNVQSVSSGGAMQVGGGSNLVRFAGTGLPAALVVSAADPQLPFALADNGGPTMTLLPPETSPAVDAGNSALVGSSATDQRGLARVAGSAVDLGAVERAVIVVGPGAFEVTTQADENDAGATVASPGGTGLSLREAIALANANPGPDAITFDPGLAGQTITLTQGQLSLSDATGATTITGPTGGVIIDAGAASRVLFIGNASDPAVQASLSNLTLRNGSEKNGAGLQVFTGATATLTDVTVTGNTATNGGGGIFVATDASLTFVGGSVSGNTANGSNGGGGIYNLGTVTLTGATVDGNQASAVTDNGGGGIYSEGAVSLATTTVSNNTAQSIGGGIVSYGTLDITASTLSGNTAAGPNAPGGALFAATLTMTNSTVSGNSAGSEGGGLVVYDNSTITNSTITANRSHSDGTAQFTTETGGGVYLSASTPAGVTLTLRNTVVHGNYFGPGTSTSDDLDRQVFAGFPTSVVVTHSIVGVSLTAFAAGSGNNLSTDPLLGPLANNGGPTPTHALLAGSPAIDAGDPDVTGLSANDQRGAPWVRVFGGRADIGAVEVQSLTLVVDTTADVPQSGTLTLREAIALANINPGPDVVTFDPSLAGQAITLTLGQLRLTDTSGATSITGPAGGVSVSGNNASRVFDVGAGATALLSGLTVTGGAVSGDSGGGIKNDGHLTLTGVTVSGNSAEFGGGGVFNSFDATLTVSDSQISNNQTPNAGGGILSQGTLTVSTTTVAQNQAGTGGGIYSETPTATTITDATVSGNSSSGDGGGLLIAAGPNALTNVTVSGNTANGTGGGLTVSPFGTLTLLNSTVTANHSDNDDNGGEQGGGLHADFFPGLFPIFPPAAPTIALRNTIVAGNFLGSGATTANDLVGQADFTLTANYSLLGVTSIVTITGGNNVGGDPLLGPLADNGGPTQTHLPASNSPVFDAGDPDTTGLAGTDQRGLTRVIGRVDIGAVERQAVPGVNVGVDGDGVLRLVEAGNNTHEQITLSVVGNNLRIQDANTTSSLSAGNGAIQVDGNTVDVPLSSITNGIVVQTLGGDDSITLDAALAPFTGPLSLDGGAGFDTISSQASLTLAADKDASLSAEEVTFTNAALNATGLGDVSVLAGQSIQVTNSTLSSVNGDIDLQANQGATSATGNFVGIDINAATVQVAGTGTLTLQGCGGTDNGGGQIGVRVRNAGVVAASYGLIDITGTGGNSTGAGNHGVLVTGTNSRISSSAGDVNLTGIEGNGDTRSALTLEDAAAVSTAKNGGSVTLTGDSLNVANTASISATLGSVRLRNRTMGVALVLGGNDAAGVLGITDAELDRISTASLQLGDAANTGDVIFSANVDRAPGSTTALTLTSGASHNIDLGNFSINAGNGPVALTAGATGIQTTATTGASVVGSGVSLSAGAGGIAKATVPLRLNAGGVTAQTTGNGNINLLSTNAALTVGAAGVDAGSGAVNLAGGTFALGGSERLSNGSDVTLAAGATLDLNGFNETVKTLTGQGLVTNGAAASATLTVGAGDASSTFGGRIQNGIGAVGLTKTGSGSFTLGGANTYTGATTVSGTLLVQGSLTSRVTAQQGATLGGGGTINPGSGDAVTVTGDNVTIRDVSISGATNGVVADGVANLTLNNVRVQNHAQQGLSLSDVSGTTTLTDLTLLGNGSGGALSNVARIDYTGSTADLDDFFSVAGNALQHTRGGSANQGLSLNQLGALNLFGGGGVDNFDINPLAAGGAAVNVVGGTPTAPAQAGDSLSVHTNGATDPQLTSQLLADGHAGRWTFGNAPTVTFAQVETFGNLRLTVRKPVNEVLVGTTMSPKVRIKDEQGRLQRGFNGTVTLEVLSGPGRVSGTLVVEAVNGVARFKGLRVNALGTYRFRATASGLTSVEFQREFVGRQGRH